MFEHFVPPPEPQVTVVPKRERKQERTDSVAVVSELIETDDSTIDQPSKQPTQKVGLGVGLGGGFILGIQLWLRERFGINLLDVEVGLLTWLFTFGAAYFVRERNRQGQ